MADYFYLQDRRGYVGNCMQFWAKAGGYTTDIEKARRFSREDAFKQHAERPDIDIPIPCEYLLQRTTRTVDCQRVNVKEALEQKGLSIIPIPKPKKPILKCHGCGRFLTEREYYTQCSNCGACNRP